MNLRVQQTCEKESMRALTRHEGADLAYVCVSTVWELAGCMLSEDGFNSCNDDVGSALLHSGHAAGARTLQGEWGRG